MPFIPRQEEFDCEQCLTHVDILEHGSYRNHCPHCLFSKHVDRDGPGDRQSDCRELMKPISLESKGELWRILHKCTGCGKEIWNKSAPDDDLVNFSSDQQQ